MIAAYIKDCPNFGCCVIHGPHMLIHMKGKFTCLIEIETCNIGYLWMHKRSY